MLNSKLCVVDANQFRKEFLGYVGNNSDQSQRGSSLLVDAALDLVLKYGYSFILNGMFATKTANQNNARCLKKNYDVLIYYIYQDSFVAWNYTKQREKIEGRFVPKEHCITVFFKLRSLRSPFPYADGYRQCIVRFAIKMHK